MMSMGMAVMVPVVAMLVMTMLMRIVPMRMAGLHIGAAFGIERRLDLGHAPAKSLDHGFDDVVAADAQSLCHDLRRQMAVAEMPGDADQMPGIAPADFREWFGRRH